MQSAGSADYCALTRSHKCSHEQLYSQPMIAGGRQWWLPSGPARSRSLDRFWRRSCEIERVTSLARAANRSMRSAFCARVAISFLRLRCPRTNGKLELSLVALTTDVTYSSAGVDSLVCSCAREDLSGSFQGSSSDRARFVDLGESAQPGRRRHARCILEEEAEIVAVNVLIGQLADRCVIADITSGSPALGETPGVYHLLKHPLALAFRHSERRRQRERADEDLKHLVLQVQMTSDEILLQEQAATTFFLPPDNRCLDQRRPNVMGACLCLLTLPTTRAEAHEYELVTATAV